MCVFVSFPPLSQWRPWGVPLGAISGQGGWSGLGETLPIFKQNNVGSIVVMFFFTHLGVFSSWPAGCREMMFQIICFKMLSVKLILVSRLEWLSGYFGNQPRDPGRCTVFCPGPKICPLRLHLDTDNKYLTIDSCVIDFACFFSRMSETS